jgi:hypothetical protein
MTTKMANEVRSPFLAPHPAPRAPASSWPGARELLRRLARSAACSGRLGLSGVAAFLLPGCNASGTALVELAPAINARYEGERVLVACTSRVARP